MRCNGPLKLAPIRACQVDPDGDGSRLRIRATRVAMQAGEPGRGVFESKETAPRKALAQLLDVGYPQVKFVGDGLTAPSPCGQQNGAGPCPSLGAGLLQITDDRPNPAEFP